jgi:hypothetical protein
MNIDLGHANNSVEISVWFKRIDGPPEVERTSDYLNDISAAVGDHVQHVELRMTNGDVYTSVTEGGVVCKPDKDHSVVNGEGFWIGFKVCVPISEANRVQEFARNRQGQEYSFADLIRGFFGGCCVGSRMAGDLRAKHTCTSICFEALAQSDTFCGVLSECFEDFRKRSPCDASFFTCNPNQFFCYLERMAEWCTNVEDRAGVVIKHKFSGDRNRAADIMYYKRMNERERKRHKDYDSFSSSSGSDADVF